MEWIWIGREVQRLVGVEGGEPLSVYYARNKSIFKKKKRKKKSFK